MSPVPLAEHYDVGLFDLDGVVYSGDRPVEHAAASIAAARERGMGVAFVTNNASRTPEDVAAKLSAVGVSAELHDIITSAQVAAEVLRERLPEGARVLVVGDAGLVTAVAQVGLQPVYEATDDPAAVVQGHSPKTGWSQLAEAVIAIRAGAMWVASNTDSTIPTARGILPGNGAFVRVVAATLGRDPDVIAGKPGRAMHRSSVERTHARRPLVIGDRLDTDIEGAANSDCDSLCVLTGVTTADDLLTASHPHRPTYIGSDLRALLRPGISVADAAQARRAGRWSLTADGISAEESAPNADDAGEFLTLACAAAWSGNSYAACDEHAQQISRVLRISDA